MRLKPGVERVQGAGRRLLETCLPPALRGRSSDEARRARLTLWAAASIAACALILAGALVVYGPIGNLPPTLGAALAAGLVPALLRATGSVRLAGNACAAIIMLGLGLAAVGGGGQLATPYILLASVPMLAGLVLGARAGLVWTGGALVGLAALALALEMGLEPSVELPADPSRYGLFRGSAVMLIFVLLVTWAYDRLRRKDLSAARSARSEAERRGEALAEFTYAAAHDLREPLRGLHSCAGFLLADSGDELGEEARVRLRTLQRLAERMDSRLEAFRRVAELGEGRIAEAVTDVGAVAAQVVAGMGPEIAERGATVSIATLPEVRCDRELLATLLQHLLENALRFHPGADVRVSFGMLPRPAWRERGPVLFVEDNGAGIPPRHREAIFRLFKRLQPTASEAETPGVGLALVKKIVDLHEGEVWVDAEEGGGTRVCFSLGAGSLMKR